MLITRRSQLTGIEHTIDIDVTMQQLNNYINGELLQYAFPNISIGEREFIKTGITPQEWDNTFNNIQE